MGLALYHYNSSVCSEKVRMVLNEKGETGWESHEVDLFTGGQFDPAYMKLNPKAVVPTLVDDGRVLTESTLIAEYLDDKFAAPPLKPADPFERAQMRLYSKMCDEGLHQGVAVLSYSAMFMERLRKMPPDKLKTHLSRIIDLERRDRQTAVYHDGVEAPHVYRGTVVLLPYWAQHRYSMFAKLWVASHLSAVWAFVFRTELEGTSFMEAGAINTLKLT